MSEVGVQRILGLMASLSEDPVVLGINDIKEKKEEETEIDNNNNKEHIDKVVVIGREEGQSGGGGQCGERDMAHPTGNPIHRSGSRPQLDLSKAAIQGNFEERNPTILLPNQSDDISHLALDIGGMFGSLLFFRHAFFFFYGLYVISFSFGG